MIAEKRKETEGRGGKGAKMLGRAREKKRREETEVEGEETKRGGGEGERMKECKQTEKQGGERDGQRKRREEVQ